jgi:predicted glycosyltransferase
MDQYPQAAILLITGSQMIHSFRIPEGIDYIKLPCLDWIDPERCERRVLTSCSEAVKTTRRAIIKKSVLGFDPDLMIVDKGPAGVDGELLQTLNALRETRARTKIVLGMRDILDAPERTCRKLQSNHSFEIIEKFYDEVWIYGSREIFDTVREYRFPKAVANLTHFCGYLKRKVIPNSRSGGPPHVLVTTGGDGDGCAMIEAYLEGLSSLPRNVALRSTIIFGPQMWSVTRVDLLQRYGYLADVTFLDFEPDISEFYADADIVVAMAGYNTVCELMSFGRRAILVPRAELAQEQLIRARLLSKQGIFDLVEPAELNSDSLIGKVIAALKPVAASTLPFDLDGLPRIRQRIKELLGENALHKKS